MRGFACRRNCGRRIERDGAHKMREKIVCMGDWKRQRNSASGKVNFRLICNYEEE
jgi:hypothetical protein